VGAGQALPVALLLVCLSLGQHGGEALVGDDVGVRDPGVLVEEHAAGEPLLAVEDLDAPVGVLVDAAALAREGKRLGPGLDEGRDALGPNCVAPRFFFASEAVTRKMLAGSL